MKIEQAIDRNEELKGELITEGRLEKAVSVQLAIEALKRILYLRKDMDCPHYLTLPGETSE